MDQGGGGGSRRTAFVILTCGTSGLRPKRLRVEHLCIAGSGSQGFAGSSLEKLDRQILPIRFRERSVSAAAWHASSFRLGGQDCLPLWVCAR